MVIKSKFKGVVMMIKRVKIGILGMDEIFYGGIFERNVVFFSGGFGIGKLIFL